MPNPTFELSIDTRLLYDHLRKTPIGETVSFDALSEVTGAPVHGSTSSLQSAIRRLQSIDGRIFASVRGVGYQRLSDVGIVRSTESARDTLRRRASRMIKRLACVEDFGALPKELQVKHNASMSMFGAIAHMLKPSSTKILEDQVAKAQAALPLAKTLEAFKS